MDNDENLKQQLDAYLAENFNEENEKPPRPYTVSFGSGHRELSEVNLENFLNENKGKTFAEMLIQLIKDGGKKYSAVYNNAEVSRQVFSKIRKNEQYQPSKDTAIAFALALELDIEKAKELIAAAGYSLTKSKRDLIITFFFQNEIFDTDLLNRYLHEYNQRVLFQREKFWSR